AEQELRRALTHGLQQVEVDREALEQKSPYLIVAANANTRSNVDVVDLILSSIESNRVPTDPKTDLDLYTASINGLKAKDVTATLKATFSGWGPSIFVASGELVGGGEYAIRQSYAQSGAVAVAAPPPSTIKAFSYRDFGPAGKVAEQKYVGDIGTTLVKFANGV